MKPNNSLLTYLGNPSVFLDQLFEQLHRKGIDTAGLYLDHICYRVESPERYEAIKSAIAPGNTLLTESFIAGRPIASYLLSDPIYYKNRRINCLELPAPKPGNSYSEGFEHVEFVIKEPFDSFMSKYPEITFKTKGMNKSVNATISIPLDGMAVKFHHHPLPYVIQYLDDKNE